MARVGIGVPVFNGGELLRECLDCLRTQTFGDIEVLIGDNASTDQTPDICAEFAARDSRFRHIRRPENIGVLPNFIDLRDRSTAPLFMWRAHDDLSDANYVEALAGCFDRDPGIRLAVGTIVSRPDDRPRPRTIRYRPPPGGPRVLGIARQLFASHASWIYGLWDRATLARTQDRVHAAFPHPWGWDHLALLPQILDGRIAGTAETSFVQRILRAGRTRAERQARRPGLAEMRALRGEFARAVRAEVDARDFSTAERAVLDALIPAWIDRRAYSRSRMLRRSISQRLGLSRGTP